MRIFIGHFINPATANHFKISLAASNFSKNLIEGGLFNMAFSILPTSIRGHQKISKISLNGTRIIYSKFRQFPAPLHKISLAIEQISLYRKIPRKASLWVYNITIANRLLLFLLRIFKPSVGIYPIVLDYTPGSPTAAKELKIINQSTGKISLSNYSKISKVNFKCLPGVAPEDSNYPLLTTPSCSFLLSGVLLEQISSLSKVIKVFKELPSATLYLTGDISTRKDLLQELQNVPNIKVLGKLDEKGFVAILNEVTFILSTRDSSYPENLCNFPSKIIEGLLHNRIIVSTISYSQLEGIKYFKIGEDIESMTNDLEHIISLPPIELKKYANQGDHTKRLFSTAVWKKEIENIERPYDFVYLTNTPSFYKLKLCQQIAAGGKKVLLIFYGYDSAAVNIKLNPAGGNFHGVDYIFVNAGDANKRNKLKVLFKLRRLLRHIKYRKLIYSGWISTEYNLLSLFTRRENNILVCESSVFDTNFSGLKGRIKRVVISRMEAVLPSGKPHLELFKQVSFKGKCNITGSVGTFNKGNRKLKEGETKRPLKYIYVGRLVDVKNVGMLIDAFNRNGKPLTIVGDGVLAEELKRMANPNIVFSGFVENESLGRVYQEHDVFILPSYYEPWGLVVEEALYWGLPVIVSNRVGSSIDMVRDLNTGVIFNSGEVEDLQRCVDVMEEEYESFQTNVNAIDWVEKDKRQVEAYLDLLEEQ